MLKQDLHVHTRFSDGVNTPEEMVVAAISMGLDTIGFSDHAHTPFDESWCMALGADTAYRKEISRLQRHYKGQIQILCGIEQDLFSDTPTDNYDYVIGAVHYIQLDGAYVPVDESPEHLRIAAAKYFNGDIYALVEAYYQTICRVPEGTNATIIGHFDLISKFIEQIPIFCTENPRYISAWKNSADILLASGLPFEINTGAISRGYRTTPYPAVDILEYIRSKGGHFILSGDSHSTETLCFGFNDFSYLIE